MSSVLDIFKPKDKDESKGGSDLIGKFDTALCKYTNTCIGDLIKGPGKTIKPNSEIESDPFYKVTFLKYSLSNWKLIHSY